MLNPAPRGTGVRKTIMQTTRIITVEDFPEIAFQAVSAINHTSVGAEVLREKLADALMPGYQVEFDSDEEEPAFLDDEGPSAEIPPFITTMNARDLYDLRPGETVSEAIARRNAKGS
jgi:hypothetical protein